MTQESKPIPIVAHDREVSVRDVDGRIELVLSDHSGRREVVPVVMVPEASNKRAAA